MGALSMTKAKGVLLLFFIGIMLTIIFQNCSVPFESSVDQSKLNSLVPGFSNPSIDGSNANNSSQFPSGSSDGTVPISSFITPTTGPVVYLFLPTEAVMVKDVCLSDNNYTVKVRNSGSNPKLCLTKHSDLGACANNVSNFVSIAQAGYQLVGTDWVKDGVGHSLRQLILPSQSPMSLVFFYMDDATPIPKQVGGFNVHACEDKITYNQVSFSCPSNDPCRAYYPETTMEAGSCVLTTGGVKVSCVPSYVEPGSPRSGSFAKLQEPTSTYSSGGNAGTGGAVNPGGGTGIPAETPRSGAGSVPASSSCGSIPGVSVSQFKSTMGHYNQTETGTVSAGTIMSFPFVIDSSQYPYGMVFPYEPGFSSGSYNVKDISISKCPGQFEGLPAKCLSVKTVSGRIVTDPVKDSTTCKVEHGVTYYFNIRPSFDGQDAAAFVDPRAR